MNTMEGNHPQQQYMLAYSGIYFNKVFRILYVLIIYITSLAAITYFVLRSNVLTYTGVGSYSAWNAVLSLRASKVVLNCWKVHVLLY